MMVRKRSLACVLLLALLLAAPACAQDEEDVVAEDDEYADEDKAQLLARKTVGTSDTVVGGNTTVVIEVYNAGTSSAYDVEIKDASSPRLRVLGGSLTAKFGKIAPGATVRHVYQVKPLSGGDVHAQPAVVTYRPDSPTGTDVQTLRSTSVSLTVLTRSAQATKVALSVGRVLTLGNFTTEKHWIRLVWVVLIGGIPFAAHHAYTSMRDGRKRAKYQRALQEVEKMK